MKALACGCLLSALAMTSLSASGLPATGRDSDEDTGARLGTASAVQSDSRGIGKAYPSASDVSIDRRWRIYRFERDGIDYLQINDLAGRVHLIIGRVDDLFWELPAGDLPVKVSLPHNRLPVPEGSTPRRVYQQAEFALVHYSGEAAQWSIELPGSERQAEGSTPKVCCPGDDHHNEIQARDSVVE